MLTGWFFRIVEYYRLYLIQCDSRSTANEIDQRIRRPTGRGQWLVGDNATFRSTESALSSSVYWKPSSFQIVFYFTGSTFSPLDLSRQHMTGPNVRLLAEKCKSRKHCEGEIASSSYVLALIVIVGPTVLRIFKSQDSFGNCWNSIVHTRQTGRCSAVSTMVRPSTDLRLSAR